MMNTPGKKISGIILAAGTASRMGQTKQLMPFGKTTILGRVVENALNSALSEIIVVLGHDADKICETINFSGVKIIRNKAYKKGQSTSLITGVKAVPPHSDAAMFLLGDQPLIRPRTINELIHGFASTRAPIVIPCFQGKRGNPVIIEKSIFHRLNVLSADTGARALFNEMGTSVAKINIADNSILMDVDTQKDYEKLSGCLFEQSKPLTS